MGFFICGKLFINMFEKILSNQNVKERVFNLIHDGITLSNNWEEPIRLLEIVEVNLHDSIMLIITYYLEKDENVFDHLPYEFLEKNYISEGIFYLLNTSGWINKFIKNPKVINQEFSDINYINDKRILTFKELASPYILFVGGQHDLVYDVLSYNDIERYIKELNESTLIDEIIKKLDSRSIQILVDHIYEHYGKVVNNEDELFSIIYYNTLPKLNMILGKEMNGARASVISLEYQDIIRNELEKLFKNKIIYNDYKWEIDVTNTFYEFLIENIKHSGLNNYYKYFISLVKVVLDVDYGDLRVPPIEHFEPNDKLVGEYFNENVIYYFND